MSSPILRTIDAHTAGEPLRLITAGWPAPEGTTMLERRAWALDHQDHLRRVLIQEPRGHADMYGALLTAPERGDSDAGVLFMHNDGYSTMCGHGIIAVTTIAFERGLITHVDGRRTLVLDAPAGQIRATAEMEGTRVTRVSFVNVPSFVLAAGLVVKIGGRDVPVDVAFGGAFYAVVDAESIGLAVVPERLDDLKAVGMAIAREVDRIMTVVHPLEPGLAGIYGTIFTGPPSVPDAHLRNVTVFANHEVDRSPCGTGTCAVLAVLDAMGLVNDDEPFVHESIIGTTFSARVMERTSVGDHAAIVPELTGSASITGDHSFVVGADDVLPEGFRL
ncbi:MAG: proline racemase family protein [Acidobacteria bacterium]|nr:proline racemase family protein [Acidobacteriota bacterium]